MFKRDSSVCTLRVLEAGLNICEILLDLGVLKFGDHAHSLAIGIVKRAFMHLGCPHGCNDGMQAELNPNNSQNDSTANIAHPFHSSKPWPTGRSVANHLQLDPLAAAASEWQNSESEPARLHQGVADARNHRLLPCVSGLLRGSQLAAVTVE